MLPPLHHEGVLGYEPAEDIMIPMGPNDPRLNNKGGELGLVMGARGIYDSQGMAGDLTSFAVANGLH